MKLKLSKLKSKLLCIIIILILIVFPLLWLIPFPNYGIEKDIFVNVDGLAIGDDYPAVGYTFTIVEVDSTGAVVIETLVSGTIDATGHVFFYPQVQDTNGLGAGNHYELRIVAHDLGVSGYINIGEDTSSGTFDKSIPSITLDATLYWETLETPLVSEPYTLYLWDGDSWEIIATGTTTALGLASVEVMKGLWSFDPSLENFTISQAQAEPFTKDCHVSPILIIISIMGILVIIRFRNKSGSKKGRGNLSYSISIKKNW